MKNLEDMDFEELVTYQTAYFLENLCSGKENLRTCIWMLTETGSRWGRAQEAKKAVGRKKKAA